MITQNEERIRQRKMEFFSSLDPDYLRNIESMWMRYSEALTLGLVSEPEEIDVHSFKQLLDTDNLFVLDVRDKKSFAKASIEGSINIEGHEVEENLDGIPRDKTLIVLCYGGGLSQVITKLLLKNGFDDVLSLEGGIERWAIEIDPTIMDNIWIDRSNQPQD